MNLMSGLNLVLSRNTSQALGIWAFTSDVTSVFRPECAGFATFDARMTIKAAGPAIVALIFIATYAISFGLSKINHKFFLEHNRLMNVFFSLILTFFAGISAMAFELFKCSPNPNDKSTLTIDRSINCYEDQWNSMLGLGIAAVVVWCIGFGVLFTWAIFRASSDFHNLGFQMRWKFLFIKYRPDVHWWAIAFLLKGIILNLGLVIVKTGVGQLYWIILGLTSYIVLAITFKPWRHMAVNHLDIWAHFCLILGSSVLSWFAAKEFRDAADIEAMDGDMSTLCICLLMLPIPCVLIAIGSMVHGGTSDSSKQYRVRVANELHQLCSYIFGMEAPDFIEFTRSLGDFDYYYLKQAKHVIATELFHMKSRSGYSRDKLDETVDTLRSSSDKIRQSAGGSGGIQPKGDWFAATV